MGCGCGSNGGTTLGNFEVRDSSGTVVKTFTATTETEVKVFAAKLSGATYRKLS